MELISVFLYTFLFLLLLWSFRRKIRQRKLPLPPGPSGLPILGSLLSLDSKNPHQSLSKLAHKYATKGIFSLKLGSVFTVVLTDPKLVKEAFSKDVCIGRAPLYLTFCIMKGRGILTSQDVLWKDQRKLLNGWMRILGAARGAAMRSHLSKRLSELADLLEKKVIKSNLESIDTREVLEKLLGKAACELTFGVSFPEDEPIWHWMMNIQREAVENMSVSGTLNFLPFLRYFSLFLRKLVSTLFECSAQSQEIVSQIIKLRKRILIEEKKFFIGIDPELKNLNLENEIEFRNISLYCEAKPALPSFKLSKLFVCKEDCILDLFLEEVENRKKNGDEHGLKRLSETQLKFLLADIFGAALDTTMHSLMWFFLFMAIYQEEQEKVRNEMKSICGNSTPTIEDMQHMTYVRATINEVQRIRTVVPLGIPHGVQQDTTLAGYFIPKGTMILPFLWHIHSDPNIWENPEEFKPSRFIGSDGSLLSLPSFMPFQAGKRMCPGDEFARMLMFTLGMRILSKYQVSLEKPIPSFEGILGFFLTPPKHRLKLKSLSEFNK